MEQELSARGVKAMTFYDIVLDYILMDAFEDLDSPPSSVLAVVQNRWLSNGFKESVGHNQFYLTRLFLTEYTHYLLHVNYEKISIKNCYICLLDILNETC